MTLLGAENMVNISESYIWVSRASSSAGETEDQVQMYSEYVASSGRKPVNFKGAT